MADRTFDVFLTSGEVKRLNDIKRYFIEHSQLPSTRQLSEWWGIGKNQVWAVIKRFCETGILRRVQRGQLEFGRIPYRVIDSGPYGTRRERLQ